MRMPIMGWYEMLGVLSWEYIVSSLQSIWISSHPLSAVKPVSSILAFPVRISQREILENEPLGK